MDHPIAWAALGTGITFLMTALGSATVLLVRGRTTPSPACEKCSAPVGPWLPGLAPPAAGPRARS